MTSEKEKKKKKEKKKEKTDFKKNFPIAGKFLKRKKKRKEKLLFHKKNWDRKSLKKKEKK